MNRAKMSITPFFSSPKSLLFLLCQLERGEETDRRQENN